MWDHTALYNHAQSTNILDHWSQRRRIPNNLIDQLGSMQRCYKASGTQPIVVDPQRVGRLCSSWQGYAKYKFQTHADCPRCAEFKDTAHVLLCKAPRAITQWDASIAKLDVILQKAAMSRLKALKDTSAFTAPTYTWPGVNNLIALQDSIGWRAFLEGCVAKDWAAKQQDYYNLLEQKNTGRQWTTTLIKKLWEI